MKRLRVDVVKHEELGVQAAQVMILILMILMMKMIASDDGWKIFSIPERQLFDCDCDVLRRTYIMQILVRQSLSLSGPMNSLTSKFKLKLIIITTVLAIFKYIETLELLHSKHISIDPIPASLSIFSAD